MSKIENTPSTVQCSCEWKPVAELKYANVENKTSVFCSVDLLFSTRDGLVFEGYLHSNGWVYSNNKKHTVPLPTTVVRTSEWTAHLNLPVQQDRVTAYRSLPAAFKETLSIERSSI